MPTIDLLTLVARVAGVTETCLKTSLKLNSLRNRYEDATSWIEGLCFECTLICASLAEVQTTILKVPRFRDRSEVQVTFDTTITNCMIVVSCFEKEIALLSAPGTVSELWNGDTLKNYLSHIREQRLGLTILLQMLNTHSIESIHSQFICKKSFLEKISDNASLLRVLYPKVKIPALMVETTRNTQAAVLGAVGSTSFTFDSDLMNAKVYQRALGSQATSRNGVDQMPLRPRGSLAELEQRTEQMMRQRQITSEESVWTNSETLPEYTLIDQSTQALRNGRPVLSNTSQALLPLQILTDRLQFHRPFTEQKTLTVEFRNPNDFILDFRVRTTSPKQYCVRPNTSSIWPGQSLWINIVLMPISDALAKESCKDKFMILWARHDEDKHPSELAWDKLIGRGEKKLFVDWIG